MRRPSSACLSLPRSFPALVKLCMLIGVATAAPENFALQKFFQHCLSDCQQLLLMKHHSGFLTFHCLSWWPHPLLLDFFKRLSVLIFCASDCYSLPSPSDCLIGSTALLREDWSGDRMEICSSRKRVWNLLFVGSERSVFWVEDGDAVVALFEGK